eukprot:comp22067_c0_seq1/m.32134 comp22067_c0_seq1/g.32134  ORF comp22067_c0_seq1/g.32134 comp22067_c0_seq1/m.32134 type:complete len:847 (-) comp22067_c0_seq1:496-3036(-)
MGRSIILTGCLAAVALFVNAQATTTATTTLTTTATTTVAATTITIANTTITTSATLTTTETTISPTTITQVNTQTQTATVTTSVTTIATALAITTYEPTPIVVTTTILLTESTQPTTIITPTVTTTLSPLPPVTVTVTAQPTTITPTTTSTPISTVEFEDSLPYVAALALNQDKEIRGFYRADSDGEFYGAAAVAGKTNHVTAIAKRSMFAPLKGYELRDTIVDSNTSLRSTFTVGDQTMNLTASYSPASEPWFIYGTELRSLVPICTSPSISITAVADKDATLNCTMPRLGSPTHMSTVTIRISNAEGLNDVTLSQMQDMAVNYAAVLATGAVNTTTMLTALNATNENGKSGAIYSLFTIDINDAVTGALWAGPNDLKMVLPASGQPQPLVPPKNGTNAKLSTRDELPNGTAPAGVSDVYNVNNDGTKGSLNRTLITGLDYMSLTANNKVSEGFFFNTSDKAQPLLTYFKKVEGKNLLSLTQINITLPMVAIARDLLAKADAAFDSTDVMRELFVGLRQAPTPHPQSLYLGTSTGDLSGLTTLYGPMAFMERNGTAKGPLKAIAVNQLAQEVLLVDEDDTYDTTAKEWYRSAVAVEKTNPGQGVFSLSFQDGTAVYSKATTSNGEQLVYAGDVNVSAPSALMDYINYMRTIDTTTIEATPNSTGLLHANQTLTYLFNAPANMNLYLINRYAGPSSLYGSKRPYRGDNDPMTILFTFPNPPPGYYDATACAPSNCVGTETAVNIASNFNQLDVKQSNWFKAAVTAATINEGRAKQGTAVVYQPADAFEGTGPALAYVKVSMKDGSGDVADRITGVTFGLADLNPTIREALANTVALVDTWAATPML